MLAVYVMAILPPIQLPVSSPEKAMEDGLRGSTPATHLGDADEAPGSWLQSGQEVAIASLGVNHQIEYLCLSLSYYQINN